MSCKTSPILKNVDYTHLWINNLNIEKISSFRFKIFNLFIFHFKYYNLIIVRFKLLLGKLMVSVLNKSFKVGLFKFALNKICKKYKNSLFVSSSFNIDPRIIKNTISRRVFLKSLIVFNNPFYKSFNVLCLLLKYFVIYKFIYLLKFLQNTAGLFSTTYSLSSLRPFFLLFKYSACTMKKSPLLVSLLTLKRNFRIDSKKNKSFKKNRSSKKKLTKPIYLKKNLSFKKILFNIEKQRKVLARLRINFRYFRKFRCSKKNKHIRNKKWLKKLHIKKLASKKLRLKGRFNPKSVNLYSTRLLSLKKKPFFFKYSSLTSLPKSLYCDNILKVKKQLYSNKLFKIKQINAFLKYKILIIIMGHLVYSIAKTSIKINIYHMLQSALKKQVPLFFLKTIHINPYRQKFLNLFFGFSLFNSTLICNYVNDEIRSTRLKKHVQNLTAFVSFFRYFFKSRAFSISGFKLQVKGKLGGKMRKSKYKYKIGVIRNNTMDYTISFSVSFVYTKYGVFSVKAWLTKKNEFTLQKDISY